MILERLGTLLQQCTKIRAAKSGASLHAFLIKVNSDSDVFLCNHMINMYAKCNCLRDASQIFDGMPCKNLVSWSALISGYEQSGKALMALNIFSQMHFPPNEFVYASIISACASLSALSQGKQASGRIHSWKKGWSCSEYLSDKDCNPISSLMSLFLEFARQKRI